MKRSKLEKVKEIKDTHLENLEAEAKEYRVACGQGLYFRVSPTAKKSWQVRFKDKNGKWKWYSLGAYPYVTLANARLRTAEVFVKLANNEDVLSQNALKQKSIEEQGLTFGQLIYDWLDTKKQTGGIKLLKKKHNQLRKD
ncbi:Arm DNA-binding domain-containing protein [Acinetobacter sp. ABJ_C3_5]|uniref:Arm DNA-binding domain-containing protein n=1 Tax=Acinetobacter courvalinii TaxID=280147 RepID=UPI0037C56683